MAVLSGLYHNNHNQHFGHLQAPSEYSTYIFPVKRSTASVGLVKGHSGHALTLVFWPTPEPVDFCTFLLVRASIHKVTGLVYFCSL